MSCVSIPEISNRWNLIPAKMMSHDFLTLILLRTLHLNSQSPAYSRKNSSAAVRCLRWRYSEGEELGGRFLGAQEEPPAQGQNPHFEADIRAEAACDSPEGGAQDLPRSRLEAIAADQGAARRLDSAEHLFPANAQQLHAHQIPHRPRKVRPLRGNQPPEVRLALPGGTGCVQNRIIQVISLSRIASLLNDFSPK